MPTVCPRCALAMARSLGVTTRIRIAIAKGIRRGLSSQRPAEIVPKQDPSAIIQRVTKSLEPLPQATFASMPISNYFVCNAPPRIVALMRAVALRDNTAWWYLYRNLSSTKDIELLNRSHYSQMLRALHPKYFCSNTGTCSSGEFIERVNTVKREMQENGHSLTQLEWGHILDGARALRRPDQSQIWWNEMVQDHVTPDVFCYNNYLASLCGSAPELQHVPPVRYQFDKNGQVNNIGKAAPQNVKMSTLANEIFEDMVSKNIAPNAHTYELLMIAYARDNNLDVVIQLVQRIWGLNPDGTPTDIPVATKSSSLHPTEHTLNAIANAYGYNGALKAALCLVDAMSKIYSLSIPVSTWLALLVWAHRRSTVHKRPRIGFVSPLAAPQLFKIMTSEPYNVSPGVEAYWLIIRHEIKRRSRGGSAERFLVEVLKRYGPNGTDLTPSTQHLASTTLSGIKNWVPILCDKISRRGDPERAISIFQRWQHRFHALEKTGLLRMWDELPDSRKSAVPGLFYPSSSLEDEAYLLRRQLAGASASRRATQYRKIRSLRRIHYPEFWKGPGRPLFLPPGTNVRLGLGSPLKMFQKSYTLWQNQVQGMFRVPGRSSRRIRLNCGSEKGISWFNGAGN